MPIRELQVRRTTSDEIADALREAILSGEFEDGEELNQVTLAKHFGVSRVPLREALRELQAEGLVTAKAHQRTIVTALGLERIVEILELRRLIEGNLLERAMARVTTADIEKLEKICTKMDKTTDHLRWLVENRRFHDTLYAPSDSAFTVDLISQLSKRVERYLHVRSAKGIERNREANREHWSILESVKKGDVERAQDELENHISHTRQRVETMFAAETQEAGGAE